MTTKRQHVLIHQTLFPDSGCHVTFKLLPEVSAMVGYTLEL